MAKKPNVVLFGVDSLLATHMSCYGYHRLTTPYIDRFAESGTLFEKTYCPHVPTTSEELIGRTTRPSLASYSQKPAARWLQLVGSVAEN